jgi:hypothetical protein
MQINSHETLENKKPHDLHHEVLLQIKIVQAKILLLNYILFTKLFSH